MDHSLFTIVDRSDALLALESCKIVIRFVGVNLRMIIEKQRDTSLQIIEASDHLNSFILYLRLLKSSIVLKPCYLAWCLPSRDARSIPTRFYQNHRTMQNERIK